MADAKKISELTAISVIDSANDLLEIVDVSEADADANKNITIDQIASQITSGITYIWVPATGMTPAVTSGCDFVKRIEISSTTPNLHVLDFDNTVEEFAQFDIVMPDEWDLGTVTFQAVWTAATGGTTGVAIALEGVARGDNEAWSTAYGSEVVVTDDAQTGAHEVYFTPESTAVTIGGTPAADNVVSFQVTRVVGNGNDDLAEDMRLIGIRIYWTAS